MPTPSLPRSRTVLVTGAGKRLGREIALTLARAGWQVAVHHRHSRSEAEQTALDCTAAHPEGAPSLVCHADLSIETSVRALVPAVVTQFGALDALVNSASVFEHDSAQTLSVASFEHHWMANTVAPVLLAQALHQHTMTSGSRDGVVVNLLDQKLWNPNPDFFSYTLSKAALESANTLMAQAFAPHIRVVGVAPGLTLTSHLLSDEKFAELHRQSPMGRSSTPEDVAASVAFALSNRSITGTTLLVDGGQHLMRFERDFSHM